MRLVGSFGRVKRVAAFTFLFQVFFFRFDFSFCFLFRIFKFQISDFGFLF